MRDTLKALDTIDNFELYRMGRDNIEEMFIITAFASTIFSKTYFVGSVSALSLYLYICHNNVSRNFLLTLIAEDVGQTSLLEANEAC